MYVHIPISIVVQALKFEDVAEAILSYCEERESYFGGMIGATKEACIYANYGGRRSQIAQVNGKQEYCQTNSANLPSQCITWGLH